MQVIKPLFLHSKLCDAGAGTLQTFMSLLGSARRGTRERPQGWRRRDCSFLCPALAGHFTLSAVEGSGTNWFHFPHCFQHSWKQPYHILRGVGPKGVAPRSHILMLSRHQHQPSNSPLRSLGPSSMGPLLWASRLWQLWLLSFVSWGPGLVAASCSYCLCVPLCFSDPLTPD